MFNHETGNVIITPAMRAVRYAMQVVGALFVLIVVYPHFHADTDYWRTVQIVFWWMMVLSIPLNILFFVVVLLPRKMRLRSC